MIIFNIEKIRKDKNITLYQLSKSTGYSRAYLRRLEKGIQNNPTISVLYAISTILDVNIKDLFYTKFDIEELKKEMYKRIDNFRN